MISVIVNREGSGICAIYANGHAGYFRISGEGTEDVNLRITVPEQGDDETKNRAQIIMRTCELGLIGIARDYNDSKKKYVEIIHSRTPEV